MRALVVASFLAAGCVDPDATEPLPQAGRLDAFIEQAQPVFAARCSNPSCHGAPERPLSLYAVHRYRMDPAKVYADEPLGEDELRHNFLQASIFLHDVREASRSLLLTKPLAVRAGGTSHADVDVFLDTYDYDYQRLHAWIEAALAEGDGP